MEQAWNHTYSPSSTGNTPGRSPYYPDVADQQHDQGNVSDQTSPALVQNVSTPLVNDTPTSAANNFTDTEQMLLHQLEQNLYDVQPSGNPDSHPQVVHHHHHHHHTQLLHLQTNTHSTENTPNSHLGHLSSSHTPQNQNFDYNSLPSAPPLYEFGLENMDFIIPEDLNFDTNPDHQSSAFPPSLAPPQTPAMLANKDRKEKRKVKQETTADIFASPILPGQNEKSFNNQHLYHKHNKSRNLLTNMDTFSQQPPQQHVRPDAVFTPLVSPAVTPLDSQVNVNKNSNGSYSQAPVQVFFEPLTSPALEAQQSSHNGSSSNERVRSSSSAFGASDEHKSHSHYTNSNKRRTPHGTPVLSATPSTSSSNGKLVSPSLKGVNGGSYRSSPASNSGFEKLPDSSMESKSNSSTPMLPPQTKKMGISSSNSSTNNAPLMGFTMGRLAEHSQQEDEYSDDIADDGEKDANQKSTSSSRPRRKASYSRQRSSSSSTETSPKLRSNSDTMKKGDLPVTKKASHKLAEQGRRNRMNTAVSELGSLVPQIYHNEVTIPSKATTVELASKFIRDLIDEIEDLKKNRK